MWWNLPDYAHDNQVARAYDRGEITREQLVAEVQCMRPAPRPRSLGSAALFTLFALAAVALARRSRSLSSRGSGSSARLLPRAWRGP